MMTDKYISDKICLNVENDLTCTLQEILYCY